MRRATRYVNVRDLRRLATKEARESTYDPEAGVQRALDYLKRGR